MLQDLSVPNLLQVKIQVFQQEGWPSLKWPLSNEQVAQAVDVEVDITRCGVGYLSMKRTSFVKLGEEQTDQVLSDP